MTDEIREYDYTFSVCTPTYNRAKTLHRGYESLRAQTFRDFEWLIVDDGSTDETPELVQQWIAQANFPIRYIRQENAGVTAAANRLVQEARGKYFIPLGSDNACVPTALERFKYHWDSISEDRRAHFVGVTVLSINQHGKILGPKFPRDVMDSNALEMAYKYKMKPEKWSCKRSDIARRFPFPSPDGDNKGFVPERVVFNAMARHYQERYVNEALQIYWHDEPGRNDQITRHMEQTSTAPSKIVYYRAVLNHETDWFRYAPKKFLIIATQYARYSFHAGKSLAEQFRQLENLPAWSLWLAMLPLGFIVYKLDSSGLPRRLESLTG